MADLDTMTRRARRALTRASNTVSDWHGALRLLVAVPMVYAAGMAGFVSLLFAGTAITGCFFECAAPQPLLGVALLVPSGTAVVVMVAVTTWAMSPRRARAVPPRSYVVATGAALAMFGMLMGLDGTATTSRVVGGMSLAALVGLVAVERRRLLAVPAALLDAVEDMPGDVRKVLIGVVVAADLLWVAFVVATGRCDFAGGRCPDPSPERLFASEGFWLAGGWTAAAGTLVVLLLGRRRQPTAWIAAAASALLLGVIAAG